MVNRPLLKSLLIALAAGDSLGSTSEFRKQREMPELYESVRPLGWPFKQIGGGTFGWAAGAPTDDTDMAMAIAGSALKYGEFRGEDIAQRFVAWLNSAPHDVGGTTRQTLAAIRRGQPWHLGAYPHFQHSPEGAANGSLMRNGVIAALAADARDAMRLSILHSLMTHFAPLPVLCCAAHTWLIWHLRSDKSVLDTGWPGRFVGHFQEFLSGNADPYVAEWRKLTAGHLAPAVETLLAADFDPDSFNPFAVSYAGISGYCLLTLQIAVWAAQWSLRGKAFPVPRGFPAEPFECTGGWTLAWVAMIGHDSDTYGAVAGPLIWAAAGDLPVQLTEGLLVAGEWGSD